MIHTLLSMRIRNTENILTSVFYKNWMETLGLKNVQCDNKSLFAQFNRTWASRTPCHRFKCLPIRFHSCYSQVNSKANPSRSHLIAGNELVSKKIDFFFFFFLPNRIASSSHKRPTNSQVCNAKGLYLYSCLN